jgi:hypothetical protein
MGFVTWLIIGSEVAFWLAILLGLYVRYYLNKEKLGLIFLALSPLIDLILLVAVSVDMYNGGKATIAHGIAAVYIGTSIAFGKSMITWADRMFLYYIKKTGPKPVKRYGTDYAAHYIKGWGKHVLAYLIGSAFLVIMIVLIDDASRTGAFSQIIKIWSLVIGIDLVISLSYFVWKKEKTAE